MIVANNPALAWLQQQYNPNEIRAKPRTVIWEVILCDFWDEFLRRHLHPLNRPQEDLPQRAPRGFHPSKALPGHRTVAVEANCENLLTRRGVVTNRQIRLAWKRYVIEPGEFFFGCGSRVAVAYTAKLFVRSFYRRFLGETCPRHD
jgi:hypothetical protein